MSGQTRTLEKNEGSADDDHRALMENALDSTPNAAEAAFPFAAKECQKPASRATFADQLPEIPELSTTPRGQPTPPEGAS